MSQLACLGGPRVVPEGAVKSWPIITQDDRDAVMGVFDSGVLHGTNAPNALALQREWAEYCGVKHALVVNSGTAAIHIALAAAGMGPGDEVIVPALTYWATAAAVLHANAIPVFVDIDPVDGTIDPDKIAAAVTDRTKAIIPVDIHGMPCDYDRIYPVAHAHKLDVIADACQAHGAWYRGWKVGAVAKATAFSLNKTKNLTSAEGGLVTTDDDGIADRARRVREFGEDHRPSSERQYNALGIGWMYRTTEWANAFARSQLKRLDERNATRRILATILTRALSGVRGVATPQPREGRHEVFYNYVVEWKPEELGFTPAQLPLFKSAVVIALRAEGVPLGQWQTRPVPAQDVFQRMIGYGRGCPWTCQWGRRVEYRGDDYPVAVEFIARHSYVGGVHPPNDSVLMGSYADAIRKVIVELATGGPALMEQVVATG
jgi:perosamine synthetase